MNILGISYHGSACSWAISYWTRKRRKCWSSMWMSFAVVMGFVMTRVILTILFFGLFTPISLIAKLLRKDLLDERWDKNATTYWVIIYTLF